MELLKDSKFRKKQKKEENFKFEKISKFFTLENRSTSSKYDKRFSIHSVIFNNFV